TDVGVSSLASFFFSSRRRHTRSKRDWSSDVCSSDLELLLELKTFYMLHIVRHLDGTSLSDRSGLYNECQQILYWIIHSHRASHRSQSLLYLIGNNHLHLA